jgi:hypothetical protein
LPGASAPPHRAARTSRSSGLATPPGRAGASTRLRRHAHLRVDPPGRARLLPALRRQHLRGRPDRGQRPLPDGTVWRNLTTEAKSKVAETLDEFRGNYRYNLLDENLRRLYAEVPVLAQWDDHETRNNWFPGQIVDDAR